MLFRSGAIALMTFRLAGNGAVAFDLAAVAAGIVAFFASLATVAFLMRWLESRSFALFALYRVIGGAALLTWLYVV